MIESILKDKRVYVPVIVVLAVIIFNSFLPGPVSLEQEKFNTYVLDFTGHLRDSSEDENKTPLLTLTIEYITGDKTLNFKTSKGEDKRKNNEQIERLLSLLKESSVFNLNRSSRADFKVTVQEENRVFTGFFYKSDMEYIPALRNFLKLAELYHEGK